MAMTWSIAERRELSGTVPRNGVLTMVDGTPSPTWAFPRHRQF